MSSSPFAPDDKPIDFAHLERMTMGDAALEREVLAMFVSQSARLLGMLETLPAEARALLHTLKGSARAIGAARVAECASAVELAIGEGEDPRPSLRQLSAAVAEARHGIEAMLRRS
jgi:HPt (histidine-containing phosphotransfer) domain-containing protein